MPHARFRPSRLVGLPFFSLIVCAMLGCGGNPPTAPTEISLRKLASYYGMFISTHKDVAPGNETQLREFIKSKSADADLDSLFQSARDGQPYVVVYLGAAKRTPDRVIAYEKDGVSGKRFVAFGTTAVRELDDAEFQLALEKR
jgi:hypothetical protein